MDKGFNSITQGKAAFWPTHTALKSTSTFNIQEMEYIFFGYSVRANIQETECVYWGVFEQVFNLSGRGGIYISEYVNVIHMRMFECTYFSELNDRSPKCYIITHSHMRILSCIV